MSKTTFFAGLLGLSLMAILPAPSASAAAIFGFGHVDIRPVSQAEVRRKPRAARHHHHHLSRAGLRSLGARPRAWCGWYMTRLTGIHDRALWLARNWARVGAPTRARAGAVVVWPHHVGRVEAVKGNRILVLSGNDGHAVRTRWRSLRGVIAFRSV